MATFLPVISEGSDESPFMNMRKRRKRGKRKAKIHEEGAHNDSGEN